MNHTHQLELLLLGIESDVEAIHVVLVLGTLLG